MSRIRSNIPAIRAVNQLRINQDDLSVRLQRLSTGLRINRGADDPAGLIASEVLRNEIAGIQQAISNSARANNVILTAEGALQEASALLLDLQSLVVETSNESGLTDGEVTANQLQIDSILDSLDRIANTTTFAGRKLLDGSQAYLTSGIAPAAIPDVTIYSAQVPRGTNRNVTVQVTQSAQTARVSFVGTNASGVSTTSATTIEIRGNTGAELLSFASGTTLGQVATAINNIRQITGISAVVSSTAVTGTASALLLHSETVGSDAFVSVAAIGGNFVVSGSNNTTSRDDGVDPTVIIDGQLALADGLKIDVRSRGLDARFFLTRNFAQTVSSTNFAVTGGGALFQLTPEISPNGRISVALNSVSSTRLGNAVTGLLYTMRSGGVNDMSSKNFAKSQEILVEAVNQVASYRGRLGNIQRNQIEPNIDSQSVALENVTASESVIRDADMAEELSALSRAQILIQATQSSLQIANSIPNLVLSLLS